jgi:hypothetical protein
MLSSSFLLLHIQRAQALPPLTFADTNEGDSHGQEIRDDLLVVEAVTTAPVARCVAFAFS